MFRFNINARICICCSNPISFVWVLLIFFQKISISPSRNPRRVYRNLRITPNTPSFLPEAIFLRLCLGNNNKSDTTRMSRDNELKKKKKGS